MRLISKKGIFVSSASRVSGTTGDFTVQLPDEFSWDESMVYKIYVNQVNMRNEYFTTRADNNCYLVYYNPLGGAVPAAPTPDALGEWTPFFLPLGCNSDRDICKIITEQLTLRTCSVNVLYRGGRTYYNDTTVHAGTTVSEATFALYFMKLYGYGPAHRSMGFEQPEVVYQIVPTAVANPATSDGGLRAPSEASMSPAIMCVDSFTDLVMKTSFPTDNYTVHKTGPGVDGITVAIPINVPPGAAIVYHDVNGVNAVYHRSRPLVSVLDVQVFNISGDPVQPPSDWSLIINVEKYEDVDKQYVQSCKLSAINDVETQQLLKMLLLQKDM